MFPKLAAFRLALQERGLSASPLYFAKVDVQSCFDTIPQKRLLAMVESLLSLPEYQSGKHVEISALGSLQRLDGQYVNPMPRKRYVGHSGAADVVASFGRLVQDKFVGAKANTVFVHTAAQHFETKDDLMQLLREHIERNLVKIGKKYYRQKTGIPQGSVLSTILCNFFYAELERDVLGFALRSDCLLLRLLDDFCLISVNREHAEQFLRVMHRGHPDYGVSVKAAKSLANFDVVTDDGRTVPLCASGALFPYCGVLINMQTLEVCKNSGRAGWAGRCDSEMAGNGLTWCRGWRWLDSGSGKSAGADVPPQSAQVGRRRAGCRAMLTGNSGFKIQLQAMFIDTSFNSVPTVLANLYQSMQEAAVRSFEYARALSRTRPIHSSLLISTSLSEKGRLLSNTAHLRCIADQASANPAEHH